MPPARNGTDLNDVNASRDVSLTAASHERFTFRRALTGSHNGGGDARDLRDGLRRLLVRVSTGTPSASGVGCALRGTGDAEGELGARRRHPGIFDPRLLAHLREEAECTVHGGEGAKSPNWMRRSLATCSTRPANGSRLGPVWRVNWSTKAFSFGSSGASAEELTSDAACALARSFFIGNDAEGRRRGRARS